MATQKIRVAIVSTIKAPIEILRQWIHFHLNAGIEGFFLFLDDPGDSSHKALTAYETVRIVCCSNGYWKALGGKRPGAIVSRQKVNLAQGVAMAASEGFDWVAHIDSDELIRPLKPMDQVLSATNAAAIRLDLLEAVSEQMEYPGIFDTSLFKRLPDRKKALAARLLGCRQAFRFGEYFRGHTESKMLFRTDGSIKEMGIHKPIELRAGATVGASAEVQLLHFDCIGFSDWDRKWQTRLGDSPDDYRMRPARCRQFEAYRNATVEGYEARIDLFRNIQMIPQREQKWLRKLGLLERFELDRGLFVR